MEIIKSWILDQVGILSIQEDLYSILGNHSSPAITVLFSGKFEDLSNHVKNSESQQYPDILFVVCDGSEVRSTTKILKRIRFDYKEIPIIAIVHECSPGTVDKYLSTGISGFVNTPISEARIFSAVDRVINNYRYKLSLTQTLYREFGLKQIIGEHPTFCKTLSRIPILADYNINVLLCGETGTGKELFARAIHYLSNRAGMPFVPINCGALPVELVESELFGHVKGSYTGATTTKPGLVEAAANGTLFLDEVDCLPLVSQVKILRLLEECEYRPVGSTASKKVNIRILAATNTKIEKAVTEGRFRSDLYYRIKVAKLDIPPLREHSSDIPLLTRHFLKIFSQKYSRPVTGLTDSAMSHLCQYDWPGNIRELKNVIEQAVIFANTSRLSIQDINLPVSDDGYEVESMKKAKARAVEKFERGYIEMMLIANQGNVSKAARCAGKHRRAFWELITKHKVDVNNIRAMSKPFL